MPSHRSLDQLRDEYDTSELLEAIDHFDTIRGLVGGSFEPPEVRQQLDKLHTLVFGVVNEYEPLPTDPYEDIHELIWEITDRIGDISEAADSILSTLRKLGELCPVLDEDEIEEDDTEQDEEQD